MPEFVVVVRVEAEVIVDAADADDAAHQGLELDGKTDVLSGEVLEVTRLK